VRDGTLVVGRRSLIVPSGVLERRLGSLAASVDRLVEQLPMQDPLGLGDRLLGALCDASAALAQRVFRTGSERRALRQRAKAAAAEAGYLVRLCRELGYGRPEQADSAVGRVDALERALKSTGGRAGHWMQAKGDPT
jgi:hypothetical protein